MYYLNDIAFYITNVCNLACKGCESFNNYNLKGHQKWEDYKDLYKRWSEILEIETANIHGGEPILNPNILAWADGIKELWPNCEEYYVSGNGTSLTGREDTARALLEKGWSIDVCLHDPMHRKSVEQKIEEIIKDYDWFLFTEDCDKENHYRVEYTADDQVLFSIEEHYEFSPGPITKIENGTVYFNRNDIETEHEACMADLDNQCHGFNRGILYKCPFTASVGELPKHLKIEQKALDLINQVKPGIVTSNNLDDFFATIKDPLPTCTLCNYSGERKPIHPMPKKPIL